MIIRSKQMAYPVPGLKFDGHKLFMEIHPGDSKSMMEMLTKYVERTFKDWVHKTPDVKYTKNGNVEPIIPVRLESV